MGDSVSAFIVEFLGACSESSILELVVDTSVPANTPYLNLWAWKVQPSADFDDALKRARAEEDIGFLYDVLEEERSSCFELSVAGAYPQWPEEIERGDAAVRGSIASALAASGGRVRAFFHHVDDLELDEVEPAS